MLRASGLRGLQARGKRARAEQASDGGSFYGTAFIIDADHIRHRTSARQAK